MRFKFTIFLFALNIITFGLIAYLNNQAKQTEFSTGGLSAQIGRELIEADRIELSGRGLDKPRILERRGSSWALIEPMQWSANYFAINRILNQLQFLEEEASFTIEEIEKAGQTLADYGLAEPILKLTIAEKDEAVSLRIGTVTEIGNKVYLLGPNQREIFVVNSEVIGGLLVDLNDLRTREIFDIPVFEVAALGLQIRSENPGDGNYLKVRLARNSGEWTFEAPLSAKADPALVNGTINTLTAAKVGRFVEAAEIDPLLQGLENPFMRVTIHGNKRRQTLLIGNIDPVSQGAAEYFAKLEDNPAVFTVSARPFDDLREAQEALRERNFMSFDRDALSAVNIAENGRKIRLQKLETGDWQVLESTEDSEIRPHRADPEIIQTLIDHLAGLRAIGFAVDAPSPTDNNRLGFNQPRRIVTLSLKNEEAISLTLAHPEDDENGLYARTTGADFIYEVDRQSTLNILPLNTRHYRIRSLDTLPQAAKISAIRLSRIDTDQDVFNLSLNDAAADWVALLEMLDAKTAGHIEELLASVRTFRVDSYLLDRFEHSYPLNREKSLPWVYRLSATIQLPGGETDREETREYFFTERISGTIQGGGSERHKSIFEIPQTLIDTLYELTDDMELPPEAKDEPIPDPAPIEPIPEAANTQVNLAS
jgi:hypothetical protein